MNKFFTKVAAFSACLAMAIGVGVAVGSGDSKETTPAHAAAGSYVTVGSGTASGSGSTGKLTFTVESAVTITVNKGSSSSNVYTTNTSWSSTHGNTVRVYVGNVIAVEAASGYKVAGVKFKNSTNGSYYGGTYHANTSWSSTTSNITSDDTTNLTLTNCASTTSGQESTIEAKSSSGVSAIYIGTTKQIRNQWMKVKYVSGSSTFTVTIAVNNGDYGSVNKTSVTSVTSGTSINASSNVLTVGTTTVTATPTTSTPQYTYAFSSWTGIPAGGTVTANVTVTANFTRTVNPVSSLAISGSMTKTTYNQGDAWDPSGFTVNAYYSGSPSTPVNVTSSVEWSYSPATTASTSTTSVTCTASLGGKSATSSAQSVTVNEKKTKGGIVDGGKYVMVWDDGYYLPSANYSGNPGPLATYSDAIHNTESNCWTFEAEGNTDDTWNIKSASGEYLYCTNAATGVRTGSLDTSNNQYDFTVSELEETYLGKTCLKLTVGSSGGNRTLTHYTANSGNDVRAYTTEINGTWEVVLIQYEAPDPLDEDLTISGYTDSFTVGDTFEFGGTATASYAHGDEDVTNDVTFELAGEPISEGDTITGDMVGNDVEVGVWYTDAKSNIAAASYTVDISYAAVTSVSISKSTPEMGKVSSFTFGATVLPSTANPNVTWSVAKKSGDISSGFSINSSGLLTVNADAGGVLTVTATTVGKDSSSASKVATVDVTITGDPVVAVSSALAGYSGKNTNLAYSFSNFTDTLSVVSSDTSKVTVGTPTVTSGTSGSGTVQVNFVAAGSSTLTFKNGSDSVATCIVTVTASAVSSVSWGSASDMTVYSGSTALNASKITSWAPHYVMNNGDEGSVSSNYTVQLNGTAYSLGTALTAGTYEVSLTYGGQTTSSNPTVIVVQSLHSISYTEEGDYSHTSATKWSSYSDPQVLSGVTWTPDVTWEGEVPDVQNVDGTKGQQIGTAKKAASAVKLSTTGISGTISEIVVNTSGASEISATLSVKVGTTSFTCSGDTAPSISATATSYTFTGSASGTIEISWASGGGKAIYFKSVSVSYSLTTELTNQADHEATQAKVVEFAQYMNTQMNGSKVCTGDMSNLGTAWSNVASKYNTLFGTGSTLSSDELAYAKNMLANASASWNESHDSDEQYCLERAMKTYEWCVSHYSGTCNAFMSSVRPVGANTRVSPLDDLSKNSSTIIIVVVTSLVAVAAIGGYFFLRKRKED